MKYIATIAFISTYLFSFGQGQSGMFWNTYTNFNPAMSGFQYTQQAGVSYTEYYPNLAATYVDLRANYDMNIAEHHGVGINYTGEFTAVQSNQVFLNYNYQFLFEKAGKLSVGTGLGIRRLSMTPDHFLYANSIAQSYNPEHSFELNMGVAYNKGNLHAGASIERAHDLIVRKKYIESYPYDYAAGGGFNIHAQYAFTFAKKFQLTPRLLYSNHSGFQQLRSNLTFTYNGRYSLGVSNESRDRFGVNVGWDIKNKFRVAYMFSQTISKLNNNVSGGTHELTLAYIIKRQTICAKALPVSPDF